MSTFPPLGILAVVGYLLGSIPFGLLITRAMGVGDIRKIGSGNIGATNVLRTGRKGLAAATLLLDAAKGAVAVLIGMQSVSDGVLVMGLAAMLGHIFPIWLGFKGGKGVATGLGVLIAASPISGVAVCLIWLVVAKLSKFSSAAALVAFAAAPILVAALTGYPQRVLLAFLVAALVWVRHEGNIRRLLAGTEPRIGQK